MLKQEMRNEKAEITIAILETIRSNDGVYYKKTLADSLHISQSTVAKYLESFIDRGVVRRTEEGRNQKLYVTEHTNEEIEKLKKKISPSLTTNMVSK